MIECAAAQTHSSGTALKELAAAAGCSVPAAFHLAQTLVDAGFLRREENPPRFFPGDRLLMIAGNHSRRNTDASMERLMNCIHAAYPEAGIYYCNESGANVQVHLQLNPGDNLGKIAHDVDYILPPYTSVASLMHLAFWPAGRVRQYEAAHDFDALGTILWPSREALRQMLNEIRGRGWFFLPLRNPHQLRAGFGVFSAKGEFRGSLTVSRDLPQTEEPGAARDALSASVLTVLRAETGWAAAFGAQKTKREPTAT